jgi:hypothetical protein
MADNYPLLTHARSLLTNNSIYIQPYHALADNVISHRIKPSCFMRILNIYGGLDAFTRNVDTKYYHEDTVLEIDKYKNKCCYMIQDVKDHSIDVERKLVLVQENRITLSVMRFPLNRTYHHERQSIILIQEGIGYTLELEILVPNIKDPIDRLSELPHILNLLETSDDIQPEDLISQSFRFYFKHTLSDLNRHIERLTNV